MKFFKYIHFGFFFVSKIEQVVWYTIPPGLVYQHPMVNQTKNDFGGFWDITFEIFMLFSLTSND